MSFFTYLWKNETWSKKVQLSHNGYSKLDYAASDRFKVTGITRGATVFIVTVKQGVLYLGGYIKVYDVLNCNQAAKYLKRPEHELWKASDYIVACQGEEIDFRSNLIIPLEQTKRLELVKDNGFVNLKMDSDGKLDRQTLRNVRKLYTGSEKILFDLLAKSSD